MIISGNDLFLAHHKPQSATRTSIDSSNENLSSSFDGSCTTRGGTGGRAILEQWKIFRITLRKRQRQRVGLGGDEDDGDNIAQNSGDEQNLAEAEAYAGEPLAGLNWSAFVADSSNNMDQGIAEASPFLFPQKRNHLTNLKTRIGTSYGLT